MAAKKDLYHSYILRDNFAYADFLEELDLFFLETITAKRMEDFPLGIKSTKGVSPKPAQEFAMFTFKDGTQIRDFSDDRALAMDTVQLQSFNDTHGEDVRGATLYHGPASDALARSMNAFAVTIGSDIFFRSNKFNPTTEEGRQTLAHELTHVAQHQEGRITDKTTKEEKDELEDEAFQAEMREKYGDPDPLIAVRLSSGLFRFRRSKMEKIAYEWADIMLDEIKAQKWKARDEQEYLGFLLRIDLQSANILTEQKKDAIFFS